MRWEKVLGSTGVIYTDYALIPTCRVSDREVVLIDSGAQPHPELLEDLAREGLTVPAVLCTHLHPDHVANNRPLIDRFGTQIYAHPAEIRDVGPRYALLRADPLEQKWLPTEPDYPILPLGESGEISVGGARFGLIPLPGHVEGHLGIVTPDGVCCFGDAMMSDAVLAGAMIPYMEQDVDLAVESMAKLKGTRFPRYIAAHRAVLAPEALPALADANIQKELSLYRLLLRTVDRPMELETAVTAFMKAAGVTRDVMLRRVSIRSSARTRFAALVRAGELAIRDGTVYPVR